MKHYDPETAPDPSDWLSLDEHQRLQLTEAHHRATRVKHPSIKAHTAIHLIVENQIAMGLEPVVRAMSRLKSEGLPRHEAIHAIGSVAAEHFFEVLKSTDQDVANTAQAATTLPSNASQQSPGVKSMARSGAVANPSFERTATGKPAAAAQLER